MINTRRSLPALIAGGGAVVHHVRQHAKELQHEGHALGSIGVVVDHEHAARRRGRRHRRGRLGGHPRRRRCRVGGHRHARQPHDEPAAGHHALAVRLHRAAVHLHDAAHQRETDAQPALRVAAGIVGLREEIEHVRQHVGLNADAVVFYHDDCFPVAIGRDLEGQAGPDLSALGRVFGCIADQIGDDLLEPDGIPEDMHGFERHRQVHALMFRLHCRLVLLGRATQELGEFARLSAQRDLRKRHA